MRRNWKGKRRILTKLPANCYFAEVQDFRDAGDEVVFYCVGSKGDGTGPYGVTTGIYCLDLKKGEFIPIGPGGVTRTLGGRSRGSLPTGRGLRSNAAKGARVLIPAP